MIAARSAIIPAMSLSRFCFVALLLVSVQARATECASGTTVRFDEFMQAQVLATVPLDVLVPEGFAAAPRIRPDDAQAYSYWMRPEDVDGALASGELPTANGYLYGKLSLDVGFDPEAGKFIGVDDDAGLRANGFSDIRHQDAQRNGHGLHFLEARVGAKKIYAVYVALNIDTMAAYLSFTPPGNDIAAGDCYWAKFKAAMLGTPAPARTTAATSPPRDFARSLASMDDGDAVIGRFASLAAAGDMDGLVAMFGEVPLRATGDAQIRSYLATDIVPFFAAMKRIDGYAHINGAQYEDGSTGQLHYGYIETKAGTYRPFQIALQDQGGTIKVMNIQVDVCTPDRHPVTKGRCDGEE